MSGELITIEVENTTDVKIGRAGKIFLPKSVRVTRVSPYGVAEIRACKGLIVQQYGIGDDAGVEDAGNTTPDQKTQNVDDDDVAGTNFVCIQCDFVGKSAKALAAHIRVKHPE